MTQAEFGAAYTDGCRRTVRFLLSRGLCEDDALETAQAAWVRGWERRAQIRDIEKTLTWVNSIALNLYRSRMRREPRNETMRDFPVPPGVNLDSIDAGMMLERCLRRDRELMERHYLYGYGIRELARYHGCTETALRVRLMRARRRLRRLLEGHPRIQCDYINTAPTSGRHTSRRGICWIYYQAA